MFLELYDREILVNQLYQGASISKGKLQLQKHQQIYGGTSQLRHHSGPKIYVVKQMCRCSEVFKMADKSACREFHRTREHRPMEAQTK